MLDIIKQKRGVSINDSPKISVVKAVTRRIVGTIDTMIISFLLTGNVTIAFSIGSIEVMSKMILYYFHERAWSRITRKNEGKAGISE